jgi:type VI secretion system VasD/TssJ family lipoprotein
MKKCIPVLFVLCLFLFSCASGPTDQQKWGYEKDAIILHIKADPKLNFKDKKAHALMVCVYQLMSPNAFNQLAGSRDGLYKLLECSVFDPASIAVTKQIVVNPGKDMDLKLDRAEGARFVALVAGYYASIDKEKITRIYQIPEVSRGWFKSGTKPGKLEETLVLGPVKIQKTTEGN